MVAAKVAFFYQCVVAVFAGLFLLCAAVLRAAVLVVVSVFVISVIGGLNERRVQKKRAPVGAGARSRWSVSVSLAWAACRGAIRRPGWRRQRR